MENGIHLIGSDEQKLQEAKDRLASMPSFKVIWDTDRQQVELEGIDPAQFKTWDFILAVLDMAKTRAAAVRDVQQAQQIRQQQINEMEMQRVRMSLR